MSVETGGNNDIKEDAGKFWVGGLSFSTREAASRFISARKATVFTPTFESKELPNIFLRLWWGLVPLGMTYWFFGVLLPFTLCFAWSVFFDRIPRELSSVFSLSAIAYIVFINICIWKAASHPQTDKFWGAVAKGAVVLSIALPSLGIAVVAFLSGK